MPKGVRLQKCRGEPGTVQLQQVPGTEEPQETPSSFERPSQWAAMTIAHSEGGELKPGN